MQQVKDNLRNVQDCCLEILEVIDGVCRKHHISYSLTGGSVIGYHLYRGIIPWDDDIDIMMTRENYDKFLKVCEAELPPRYIVKNYENGRDKTTLFSKVSDENTTIVELKSDGSRVVSGVFVDVSVFDKVPKDRWKRRYCYMAAKLLVCCKQRKYETGRKWICWKRNVVIFLCKPFAGKIYTAVLKRIRKYSETDNYDYSELLFGSTIAFPKELMNEYIDVEFGGKRCMLVADYMNYLETRYGRREFYRKPRENDAPHHYIYVDCSKSYKDYLTKELEE